MFDPENRAIKVLHNPDAPVSSQRLHWQEIEVPGDVPIARYIPAFAPLNSTQIVIAGGSDENHNLINEIVTFDTITCDFKKEVDNRNPFLCLGNRSANFCENTIIALDSSGGSYHVLKYTKGDNQRDYSLERV